MAPAEVASNHRALTTLIDPSVVDSVADSTFVLATGLSEATETDIVVTVMHDA